MFIKLFSKYSLSNIKVDISLFSRCIRQSRALLSRSPERKWLSSIQIFIYSLEKDIYLEAEQILQFCRSERLQTIDSGSKVGYV